MFQTIVTGRICFLEVRRFQNQNRAAHAVVNLAMHGDHAGFIENNGRRLFLLTVATKIESLRFRIGEDIVIGVVEIRKNHGPADVDGN